MTRGERSYLRPSIVKKNKNFLKNRVDFVTVYTILNITDEKAENGKRAGVVIGFTLTLVHLIGINLTGTSVNPARSIATAISAAIYNGTTDALAQVWMFIVAPLVGAVVAALLYKGLNTQKAE